MLFSHRFPHSLWITRVLTGQSVVDREQFHDFHTVPWRVGVFFSGCGHSYLGTAELTPVEKLYPSQLTNWWWVRRRRGQSPKNCHADPKENGRGHYGDKDVEC